MAIYTAGFAEWAAEDFFARLKHEGVRRLIDVRLRPSSQLAGFAKQRDLRYFLAEIAGIEYEHFPILAPTGVMLDGYRKGSVTWDEYEVMYLNLIEGRRVEEELDSLDDLEGSVFLCSEHDPQRCHRRLAVDYLGRKWCSLEVIHIQ